MPHPQLLTFTARDITSDLADVIRASGIHTGLAHGLVRHTS